MTRQATLTAHLVRDLFRSVSGIAPLAAALAFGLIAFEYGMDQPQFITVGGLGTAAIGFLATVLLAGRADRASMVPFVARLRHRAELLAALVLGGLVVVSGLALLITVGNLAVGRLSLEWPSALWLLPAWLALWLFGSALALPLSALTSRGGSHLIGHVLTVAILVANDQKHLLLRRGLDWPVRLVEKVLWPVGTLLARASSGIHDRTYLLALGATLGLALMLFGFAVVLFVDKDLLWTE